jgi:OmcA/MtrC family decaheme c-type cytochrome
MTIEVARAALRAPHWLLLALAAVGLAACEGDTMPAGPTGPTGPSGPSGPPPGSGSPQPIASAESLTALITAVNVPEDGRPVIDIYVVDQAGRPVAGLPAGNIGFVIARLEPGVNGRPNGWRALTRRTEAFPGTPAPTPADRVTGTGPTNQGYTEAGTAGAWTDNGNGTFRYRFAKNVKADADAPFDATLKHRIGLEIRTSPNLTPANLPVNNATYTFLPPGGPDIEQSGREIVDNDTCNACHDSLAFHGNGRFDLKYCAMCHESNSFDAQSGNSLDLKVMIHKIHAGETLPSVEAGGFYGFFGRTNEFNDYGDTVYPQDKRNCTTCHEESDADTPQASNWRLVVDRTTCSSCHDDVNFSTGANHGGVAATDDQCTSCHGPNSSIEDGNLRAEYAHKDPVVEAAGRFRYEVLRVVDTAPGQLPTVTIRVVDPTNGNRPWDIKANPGPFQGDSAASLAVDVAWSTRPDFTNTGSRSATATTGSPAQPVRIDFKANGVPDPDFAGGFKATASIAIPPDATGSGSALIEGRPTVDVDGNGSRERIPVASVGRAFAITDAAPVAYRKVVNIEKCNECHQQLSLHGNGRTDNAELCAACHNPNATDIARRVAGSDCETGTGTLDDQTIDFKVMVHAIHAGSIANYKVCGYGNTAHDYSHVEYPGKLNNCEGCHEPDTYYPPDPARAFATTLDAAPASNPDRSTPLGDVAVTPGTAVCSTCHTGTFARAHMEQNGGSFGAIKAADSSTPGAPLETCGTCHGPGRSADVKVLHGVDRFNSN